MENGTSSFVLPLPSGGTISCSEPAPKVYLITFEAPPDNRLTAPFIKTLTLALDVIEHRFPKGIVVTTSNIPKFYSNGLDFEHVMSSPNFFFETLYPFWRRLLTYPMPTIALINGHAFAGGLMTAYMHDYRIQNPHRGFLCLNELHFGAPLRPAMASIFRQKLARPDTYRALVLEAKRFAALEAFKEGLVDGLGGLDETLAFVREMALTEKAASGVYGKMKEEMWRETIAYLDAGSAEVEEIGLRDSVRNTAGQESLKSVMDWESMSRNGETKL